MSHKNQTNIENDENLPAEEPGEEVKDIIEDADPENAGGSEKKEDVSAKLADLNEKYLRLYADFDNFRRRTNKEKAELIQFGNKDLLLNILPVFDDFERALELMPKTESKEAIVDGIQHIFNKFSSVLQQAGLKEIQAKGQDFDPEIHDAITKIQASPDMKGKVVDEIQKGYMLHDKIIRHSKVIVGE